MEKVKSSPPRIFLKFFRWYCHPKIQDYIEGDLMEVYDRRLLKFGKRKADIRFLIDVILLFRPGIIRPMEGSRNLNHYGMIKSYFKIGWRNLLRNKGYSAINIGGLALGMSVAILIGLWVYDELSYNTYFKNYDRIAQVTKAGHFEGKYYQGQTYIPFPLIEELQNVYGTNFKHVVPASNENGADMVLSTSDKMLVKSGMSIGEGAPEMFSWEMTYGNWAGFKDPNAIMISESTAKAFFGDSDPLGQPMKVNNKLDMTVAGVFKDFPMNAKFYGIGVFLPWGSYLANNSYAKRQGWQNHFLMLYVEIDPNKNWDEVSANVKKAEMKAIEHLDYMKEELPADYDILLQPMRNWHLYAEYKEGQLQSGPIQMVWIIGSIGVFVLLLACINFMNLSTARSEKRAKEVGIRKTIGSVRRQLVGQFFSESFLVVTISFVLAIGIVVITLPSFNLLAAKYITIPWGNAWFWLSCISFVLLTGLVAGSYPALYLSSFNPVQILKGTFRSGRLATVPRKILVVFQFSVSVILIICTIGIYNQLTYVKDRPVGYTREGLIMVNKKSNEFDKKTDVLRTELKKTGAVTEIGESGGSVTGTWSHNGGFNWEGKDPLLQAGFATLNVSHEFGKTVGWEFIDGRDFSVDIASDSAGFVLNEAAMKYMNLKNPVGMNIHWTNLAWDVDQDFKVVGVIKDMIMNSPFEPVKPMIYMTYGYERVMVIRMTPGMAASDALPKIEAVFTQTIPDVPFDYKFVDQEFARKFANEEKVGKLTAVFSTLAIFISCLGLFGVISFVAEKRTKEIGIRKVMGASVSSLWKLLTREFVILVLVSYLLASPISYYILHQGLKNYEYHTEISWWIFMIAGLGTVAIALITVSYQSIKAALTNPVNSLRSE